MGKERNYGIDCLRLVLMYMVCILHTLGQGGILDASIAGTAGYKTFWLIETASYCAVDGFALISGYTAANKPRKYEKLVEMWFQVFFYSFIVTMIFTIVGMNASWSKVDMLTCALPVTFGKFWYFTAYFALFFTIPVLNKFLFTIDETTSKKAFIILIVLYSIMASIYDPFKEHFGHSAIWLMVLYCIGALAKRIKLFETRSNLFLVILWGVSILVSWGTLIFFGIGRLIKYVSPTILLCGMIMVILFSRMKLKGTIISKLSPLAFGIYLFQLNQVVWNNVIKNAFAFVVHQPLALGVIYVFLFALAIFIAGLLIEFVRTMIAKWMRIPELSRKIVVLCNCIIEKLFVFLK